MASFTLKQVKAWKTYLTIVGWLVFILYLLYATYLLFFGFYRAMDMSGKYAINLVPFQTIKEYMFHLEYYPFDVWFNNLFGNVLLFLPLGFLIPLLLPVFKRWWIIVLLSFVLTVTIEMLQYGLQLGTLDVDDMILNIGGGWLGFGLHIVARHLWAEQARRINSTHASAVD
ncbi:VanZ family protein [Paenibacillus arenosi]|uniref:VanZ family protein n=1 Tax=Paenibacillus arenosi TaxID=2774142 RepID=A0ABR9AW07_9BACL|nr:VanZ family protein [Paenibacillus arenosi]MBD8497854.1 VanZ family protein [Paenibacillus arenosi]